MTQAWRHWYHLTLNPYGQWLRGDPRGWRERNHRLHVEGDYKHRPTSTPYNRAIHNQSKRLMKFDPVEFTPSQRRQVAIHFLKSLEIQQITTLTLAVGAKHVHALVQCPRNNPKIIAGKAKNNVWMQMINGDDKLKPRKEVPPLWAVGSHAKPIADQSHHIEAFWYILDHREEGAWCWCYLDPRDCMHSCTHKRALHI